MRPQRLTLTDAGRRGFPWSWHGRWWACGVGPCWRWNQVMRSGTRFVTDEAVSATRNSARKPQQRMSRGDWRLIFSSQKGVGLLRRRDVTVAVPRWEQDLIRILPRWRWCHCGASVVTARGAPSEPGRESAECSHSETPANGARTARAKDARKRPAEAPETYLGFEPVTGPSRSRPFVSTTQGTNDRRHHEGDGLAAPLGPRLFDRRGGAPEGSA